MDFVIRHSYLIPLLPLLGAALAGFVFGRRELRASAHWPIWIGVGTSAVLSFVQKPSFARYATESTRVGDPGHNLLVGERGEGRHETGERARD